ncbi:MAG TPA: DoxX family protein, partial [Chthoniobacterales bacterium]
PYVVGGVIGMPDDARGNLGLALVFTFTGMGHFLKTDEMAEMLPPWVPGRRQIIQVTGVLEVLFAVCLFVPLLVRPTGYLIMVFLIAVLPSNVYATMRRIDFGGHRAGPVYLLARAPLQLLLIVWTYWFVIRPR